MPIVEYDDGTGNVAPIVTNPGRLLWSYLQADEGIVLSEREQECLDLGKMLVYLELETFARIHEAMRGVTLTDSVNEQVAASVRAIYSSYGDAQTVIDTYESLAKRISDADAAVQAASLAFDALSHEHSVLRAGDTETLRREGRSLFPDGYVVPESAREEGAGPLIEVYIGPLDSGVNLAELLEDARSPDVPEP